jgi:Arc/MetJ-type ribon-helix-helix transcriptional regulator
VGYRKSPFSHHPVLPQNKAASSLRNALAVAASRLSYEGVAGIPHFPYLGAMQVDLTPDQKAFAQRAIESGRLHSEADAVQEALALWEDRERQRVEFLSSLEEARASIARGEGRVITQESMRLLAKDVKERGRARLLAELEASR